MADVKREADVKFTVYVRDSGGHEVEFKVRSTTRFEKLFDAYGQKRSVDVRALKFVFDGERVHGYQTPADLEMQDGDALAVFIEQLGGSC